MTPSPYDRDEAAEQEGPIIRDRRRIDPVTGAVREPRDAAPAGSPDGSGAGSGAGSGDEGADTATADTSAEGTTESKVEQLQSELAERTKDLQRLQAEYVNYKRRVDRDREVVRDVALAGVLTKLLPVLDDIDRARDHGELEGGFKAVADSFQRILEGLGLERFGRPGDAFDPRVHEALMHSYADDVDGPTCQVVLQPGYRIGERIVRVARVAVAEPTERLEERPEVIESGEVTEAEGYPEQEEYARADQPADQPADELADDTSDEAGAERGR